MPPKKEDPPSEFDALDKALEATEEQPRLHAILSNEDVLAARANARKRLEKERHAKAMKRVEEEEVERLRIEEGLTTGDRVKDEIVDIVIDLAPYTDRITTNGKAYYQGFTYPVPRHVADSLQEQMARTWAHQDEIDGKNKTQIFAQNRQFKLMAKGKAAAAQNTINLSATSGVSGAVPKNVGLRAGPEDHAHG